MFANRFIKVLSLLLTVLVLLVSCSSSDKKAVYENVALEVPLVVPPDIEIPKQNETLKVPEIAPRSTTYKIYSQKKNKGASEVLKIKSSGIHLVRDGAIRWLEIKVPPKKIWLKVIHFFEQTGFEIENKKPSLGILETNWLENKSEYPSNWFSRLFSGLYSGSLMDKYRIRLERDNLDNKTLIFITHQGVKRKAVEVEDADEIIESIWVPRDSDPELEVEMLQRFLVYLGNDELHAKDLFSDNTLNKRTRLIVNDQKSNTLIVNEIFARTWRRTGLAIDRLGLIVEDRDRSAGIYYIKLSESFIESEKNDEGFFSDLFSSKDKKIIQFIITHEKKSNNTEIRVLTRQGDDNKSPYQMSILKKLDDFLK